MTTRDPYAFEWLYDFLNIDTLENKWPHIYKSLLRIKDQLEIHYKDVCDIEFTIEDDKLFILGLRIARRSSKAKLKLALEFFAEGKIDLNEALSRIAPDNVNDFLNPQISNLNDLKLIGTGLPAGIGIATGKVVLCAENAENKKKMGEDIILVKNEVSPDDLYSIQLSNGILTTRGGMTSHAALTARAWKKCCVVGFSKLDINHRKKHLIVDGEVIQIGDWISINGYNGNVFIGKANIVPSNWRDYTELLIISKMIELAIRYDILTNENVGHSWIIRDYFLHNVPIKTQYSPKKIHQLKDDGYTAFKHPSKKKINTLWDNLHNIPKNDNNNYISILKGLTQTLSRVMSNNVGIGSHYKYFRPLLDPMKIIKSAQDPKLQLIGLEYFNINRYVPFLIDIYNIKILLSVKIYADHDLWFLDHTNPKGESIVGNCYDFKDYRILVNEASVKHDILPSFYNSLRKREYYWKWFEYNETTYHEILSFLKLSKKERLSDLRLCNYANDLGLLNNGNLTLSGASLSKN